MPKVKNTTMRMKMKKYGLHAKGIKGTRLVSPKEFEVVIVSDKQGNAFPSGNVSVKVGCPAVLEVASRREQERSLKAYEKKREMIKAKLKEF